MLDGKDWIHSLDRHEEVPKRKVGKACWKFQISALRQTETISFCALIVVSGTHDKNEQDTVYKPNTAFVFVSYIF